MALSYVFTSVHQSAQWRVPCIDLALSRSPTTVCLFLSWVDLKQELV